MYLYKKNEYSFKLTNNKCIECGAFTRANSGIHSKYCNRHAIQIQRHGSIISHSREANSYHDNGEYIELKVRDSIIKIDRDDLQRIIKKRWCISSGYVMTNNPKIRIHQFILGKSKGRFIDHINGDKLDNRKCNLRFVTRKTNLLNNGYLGVSWHKGAKKWRAQIFNNGKHIHLGLFTLKEDAIKARLMHTVKYRGIKNIGYNLRKYLKN